jgi:integrin beta 3
VWQRGRTYPKGAGVTYEGKFWIAQAETGTWPGDVKAKSWRLAVRNGRDGKDGKDGRNGTDA